MTSLIHFAAENNNLFPEPSRFQVAINSAIFLIFPALFIFQVAMLIHCFIKPVNNKVLWVVVLLFVPFVGGPLYFFFGRKSLKPTAVPNMPAESVMPAPSSGPGWPSGPPV